MQANKSVRLIPLLSLLLYLFVQSPVLAQSPPPGSFEGNLGTWKWGKSQPPQNNDAQTEEDMAEGQGETSWERLGAERNAELEPPPSESAPKSLTPLQLWRLLRGKRDTEQ